MTSTRTRSNWRTIGGSKSNEGTGQPMSSQRLTRGTSIDADLADYLDGDADFRRQYITRFAQAAVSAEIRTLRKLRRMKQADVARLVKTGQSAISRIESASYDGWTFKTLLGIAIELRARLRITLEPIEDVARQMRDSASVRHRQDMPTKRRR